VRDVHAAVRFEVRFAEEKPGPGLREAKVAGTNRSIYLHDEVIVTNGDIRAARVIHVGDAYNVGVEFNAAGAQKMCQATAKHVGRLVAILLDGQVIMAPVLRSPIDASAEVTGHFTKAEAERVVNGILMDTSK
jgi:preprotein translocase subunit SecD